MLYKRIKNNNGQTLIAIIFLMIVATSVGITVSSRFIASLKGLVRTDDSTKALKAAEAIVERLLATPFDTLEGYINFGTCSSACTYSITEPNGNIVRSVATITVSGNSTEPYEMNLSPGKVGQINLIGYGSGTILDVCWNGAASVSAAYVYTESSSIKSTQYAVNSASSSHFDNGFSTAVTNHGFSNCFPITVTNTPQYLRLRAYYEDARLYSIPAIGHTIPTQGILIDARGYSGQNTKRVVVLKTDPVAPAFFDYALLQMSETNDLTNSFSQN